MFFISLFIPPYIGLLYILIDVYRTGKAKPAHCWVMLFLLAIIGIYWFPWGDVQSHFAYYKSDIVDIYYSDYLLSSTYWFYDLIIARIADLTGNYSWGYFFWLLVPFSMFYYAVKHTFKNRVMYCSLFVYLLLFLGIREYLDLNRCTSAYLLFISSILLLKDNKILGIVCLISSLLLHDSVRLFLVALPIVYVLNKLPTRNINVIYTIVALCSLIILNKLFPIFMDERTLNVYFGEGWEENKGVDSGFMYILGLINLFIFFIQFVFIQINRACIHKTLYIFFLSTCLIVSLGFSMWVLRERFLIFSNIIAAAIILVHWDDFVGAFGFSKRAILKFLNYVFVTRIILNIMLVYSGHFIHNTATRDNKEEISIVSHSFFIPTIFLFDIDTFGFSDEKYLYLYDRVHDSLE